MIFDIDHEFDLPREEQEYAFACEEHERAIDSAHSHGGREIVEWRDDGRAFRRVFLYHAGIAVPHWLQKMIGREIGLSRQTMWYDRTTHQGGYDIVTEPLGDRFIYRSRFEIVPRGANRSARISRLEIAIRLPLPGLKGLAEKRVVEEIRTRAPAELEASRRFYAETWPRIRTEVIARWPAQVILAPSGALETLRPPEAAAS